MTNALANGGWVLQNFRDYLAGSTEAANIIKTTFQDILGRSIEPEALGVEQRALATGQSDQALWRIYLANSPEAQAHIGSIFQTMLARPIDPSMQAAYTNDLIAGSLALSTVQSSLAYGTEAQGDIQKAYSAAYNAPISASELQQDQAALATGSNSLTGLRDGYAQSPAALSQQTFFCDSYLGRDPTATDVSNYVNGLENGSVTLASLISFIATSPEAANYISNRWQSELGATPSTADVGAWQGYFASSAASIDVLDQNLAQSSDAAAQITADYNQYAGRDPTSDEKSTAQFFLQDTASLSATKAYIQDAAAGNIVLINALNVQDSTQGNVPLPTSPFIKDAERLHYKNPKGLTAHDYHPTWFVSGYSSPEAAAAALADDNLTILRTHPVPGNSLASPVDQSQTLEAVINVLGVAKDLGSVTSTWDPVSQSVINTTNADHLMSDGLVVLHMTQVGNDLYLTALGEGNNTDIFLTYLNQLLGPDGFNDLAVSLTNHSKTLPGYEPGHMRLPGTIVAVPGDPRGYHPF